MKFYSTRDRSTAWDFKDVIIRGLAPDGGLFLAESINAFPKEYFSTIRKKSFVDLSFDIAKQLLGDTIPADALRDIVERTIFDTPLIEITPDLYSLELYHGPTLAFKDFGARFLSGLMGHFAKDLDREIVVLAATSGDTGSAVASGFYNVKGVRVIILYPSGKVSPLQEKQLTTLGGNITAWEVQGTFDDCQRLVKQLFLDEELRKKYLLTSANSINLGRLIPQSFYYFKGWAELSKLNKPVVVSVPSGNFGNITAGVLAMKLGLPIGRFIASTNVNDVVPEFIHTGVFDPRPSKQTISNAMDVGNPSNFERLRTLLGDHFGMSAYSFTDDETREAMRSVYKKHKYILDPHGAVGYLGARRFIDECASPVVGMFLETAHPGKFHEVVEETLGEKIKLPAALELLQNKAKQSVLVSKSFDEIKKLL
ncbi:MAG: threonine synthase [Bacteroidota bacterium]